MNTFYHFTESNFQYKLAKRAAYSKVYNLCVENKHRNKILFFLKALFLTLNNQSVCIHDHRNSILVALLLILPSSKRRNLFIGDDGMHSLLVDIYGTRYLYYETSRIKELLMKFICYEIIKTNRYQQILNLPSQRYCNIYNGNKVNNKSLKSTDSESIFIDQPHIIKEYLNTNPDYLKEILDKNKCKKVLLHPRSSHDSTYEMLGLVTIKPKCAETFIINNNFKKVIGLHSTLLMFCAMNNIKIEFLKPPSVTYYNKKYIYDCQSLIKKIK